MQSAERRRHQSTEGTEDTKDQPLKRGAGWQWTPVLPRKSLIGAGGGADQIDEFFPLITIEMQSQVVQLDVVDRLALVVVAEDDGVVLGFGEDRHRAAVFGIVHGGYLLALAT